MEENDGDTLAAREYLSLSPVTPPLVAVHWIGEETRIAEQMLMHLLNSQEEMNQLG
jgi:hypothetical protein